MTRFGLRVARLFGRRLPHFTSASDAETALTRRRDEILRALAQAAEASASFTPDFTPESLKALEAWYFELYERDAFRTVGLDREAFERAMAAYFGEVAVRSVPGARWVVQEYAFEVGRYEIGVRAGLVTVLLDRFTDHFATPNNKRRQALYRRFRHHYARTWT
jgi:hypothetical protein